MKRREHVRVAAAVLLALAVALPVAAHPASDPFAAFYNSLRQKENGGSCCNTRDCFPVMSRSPRLSPSGHWEAFIDRRRFGSTAPNGWVEIPDAMVDDQLGTDPRPVDAVACWYGVESGEFAAGGGLTCFRTPGTQF